LVVLVIEFQVYEQVFIVEMKELEGLLLLQLVLVYVVVALVSHHPSNYLDGRDGGLLNRVEKRLVSKLTYYT
jgi:hypothetical protein